MSIPQLYFNDPSTFVSRFIDFNSLHLQRKELEIKRAQIDATASTLAELKAKEVNLQREAHDIAKRLRPFQHIPRDILGEIANIIIQTPDPDTEPIETACHYPEIFIISSGIWALSHVCKTWRDVVISLPSLWASFQFTTRGSTELVELYLERSRRYPLRFKMTCSWAGERDNDFAITKVLVAHSERWREVILVGEFPSAVLLPLYRKIPLLESLIWYMDDIPERFQWSDSEAERAIWEDAPSLKIVRWLKSPYSNFGVLFKFPIAQLKDLTYIWCPRSVPHINEQNPLLWDLEDLAGFTSLTELYLCEHEDGPTGRWEGDTIHIPTLKKLSIERRTWLLGAFKVPNLESLAFPVTHIDREAVDSIQNFAMVLGKGQLTEFRASGRLSLDGGDLLRLLSNEGFQSLRTLTLRERSVEDENVLFPFMPATERVVARMIFRRNSDREVILPELRHYEIDFHHHPREVNDDEDMLIPLVKAFIRSRTLGVDNARELQRQGESSDEVLIPARLERVSIDYGLKIAPVTLDNVHLIQEVGGTWQFQPVPIDAGSDGEEWEDWLTDVEGSELEESE